MSVVALITQLAEKDIRLWLEEGNLRYSAPEGAMTPDIIQQLRAQKSDIIEFLDQSEKQQLVSIPQADRNTDLAVSYAQQRLWFLNQLEPDNAAYHIHIALKLNGTLDLDKLKLACNKIVERHEILRTTYEQHEGMLYQRIQNATELNLVLSDSSTASIDTDIQQSAKASFDLAHGPVYRINLFKISDTEHYLSFTIHHIAADGWSLGIFVQELITGYQSGESVLPPLAIQYADYAAWQQGQEQSNSLEKQLEYWKTQLSGAPNLTLPYKVSPHPELSNQAKTVKRLLSKELFSQLQTFNKTHDTTLFMTLAGLYSLLLRRYTLQNDFCIGTPVAGRNASQTEPLIGCFLNVLAIRCEIDSNTSIKEHFLQVKTQCSQAYKHQDIPFEQIVPEVVEHRDLSISPVFQVMLSVQNTPLDNIVEIPGLSVSAYDNHEPEAQFDIKLTAIESDDGLLLAFEYKDALFDASLIENMADDFIQLSQNVLEADASSPIHKLWHTSAQETQARLGLKNHGFNDTFTGMPSYHTIHECIEAQCQVSSSSISVSDANHQLTYAELDSDANQLAHCLTAQGAKPGDLIGVCLYRSINMSKVLLAILKAGCAYVPFDPDFPQERLQYMAQDTGINILISDNLTQDTASDVSGCTFNIDTAILEDYPTSKPAITLIDKPLFNVIYTSGSTGKPKGVAVSHQAIINRLDWMQNAFPISAQDKLLQKTPYSFDVSVWELFWPLMQGAHLHFANPNDHKDPAALQATIDKQGTTVLHFVPSMLQGFLQYIETDSCPSIKRIFCSGEALTQEHQKLHQSTLPRSELVNLYGPTEAAIDVSYFVCQPENQNQYLSVPIGKPIQNIQLHILDEDLNLVPSGVAGELYIGGIGLAEGYINRELLTEQTFIKNPFIAFGHPSEKLYKTGDLVRMTSDDQILYLGRIDHQVKVRGNRIELGEIESNLKANEQVTDAIVIAQQHMGNTHLVAYVISHNDEVDNSAIKSQLLSKLPTYMVPETYIRIEEWPLSPNGKINRNRLPQPDWNTLNRKPYVAPSTETQQALVGIWEEVLGLKQIGIHDNFFEIGGHSLTATQAISKAQAQFKVDVPLKSIFENPCIEAIAEFIDNATLESAVFNDNTDNQDEDTETFIL